MTPSRSFALSIGAFGLGFVVATLGFSDVHGVDRVVLSVLAVLMLLLNILVVSTAPGPDDPPKETR